MQARFRHLPFNRVVALLLQVSALALSSSAIAGEPFPASGDYDASNKLFERTLSVAADGKFSLEVAGKSGGRSASGEGKLQSSGQGWQFTEGRCRMQLQPMGKDALLMQVDGCSSLWGDVMFNGRYQLKNPKNGVASTSPAAAQAVAPKSELKPASNPSANPKLAAQLNCQRLNFSDDALPLWLAQAAGVTPNKVWETEIKLAGYSFQGLPIQAVKLSESDGGWLAIAIDAESKAISSAVQKSKTAGNTSMAWLRKAGEPNADAFASKPAVYVQCVLKNRG